ncbi:MAG: PH domain-containing protein, partial [bacterium]
MEFKVAKLDRTATIVSIVTTAFLTVLSIFFVVKVPLGWLFAIFMMLIPLCCYLLSPKRYVFKGSALIIEKVVGRQITIPMNGIEAYIRVPNFAKLKVARTFGNGGLFGFYGLFSTAEYGEMNCQLTSLKDIIIIKTQKMNFALSPQT